MELGTVRTRGLTALALVPYSVVNGIVAVGLYALLKSLLPAGGVATITCGVVTVVYCGAAGYLAERSLMAVKWYRRRML